MLSNFDRKTTKFDQLGRIEPNQGRHRPTCESSANVARNLPHFCHALPALAKLWLKSAKLSRIWAPGNCVAAKAQFSDHDIGSRGAISPPRKKKNLGNYRGAYLCRCACARACAHTRPQPFLAHATSLDGSTASPRPPYGQRPPRVAWLVAKRLGHVPGRRAAGRGTAPQPRSR